MKWFPNFFTREQIRLSRRKVSELFVSTRHLKATNMATMAEFEANPDWHLPAEHAYMHHHVFRNGSCRRQRMHGAALTKRLYRHEVRRELQRELHRIVLELYADEQDHIGTRPHRKSEGWL